MVMGPVQIADNGQSAFPFTSRLSTAMPRPSPDGRSRVRRCLFGPRVPGESEAFVQREAQCQLENDSLKYNFDFINEKPFFPAENQRFEWTPVTISTTERTGDLGTVPNTPTPGNQETPNSAATTSGGCGNSRFQVEREDDNKSSNESLKVTRQNQKWVQKKLSDFMKSRKRQPSATAAISSKFGGDGSTKTPGALSTFVASTASITAPPPAKVRRTSTTF